MRVDSVPSIAFEPVSAQRAELLRSFHDWLIRQFRQPRGVGLWPGRKKTSAIIHPLAHRLAEPRIVFDQSQTGLLHQLGWSCALVTGNPRQLRQLLRCERDFHGQTVLQRHGCLSTPLPNPHLPKLEWPTMFPYDSDLLASVQSTPQTIPEVVATMQAIDSICINGDGLKWFNLLYMQVTQAVEARVNANGFLNPEWMAALDVGFAGFYFRAIQSSLGGQSTPGCWQALFTRRNQTQLVRIQFALAGMNAHINHDLPQAVLALCKADNIEPQHGTPQYADFTAINSTLDGLIQQAEIDMHLRLLGDALPPVADLDNKIAAFSMSAAREAAWDNAEMLWHMDALLPAFTAYLMSLDGLTAAASEALLIPIP